MFFSRKLLLFRVKDFFAVELNKPHLQQKQVDISEIVNISLLSFHICMRLRQQTEGNGRVRTIDVDSK